MSLIPQHQLEDVVLAEVTPAKTKDNRDYVRIKFLGLGFTVEAMDEKLIADANIGDKGTLVFQLEPRPNGNYVEMKAVFKQFVVKRRQGANGQTAASARTPAAV